jgi:hypothetical protein
MQLAKDVSNDHPTSCQFFYALNGKSSKAVVVPFDSEYRGDLFQPADHFKLSDIAGMYDCIYTLEDRDDRLIKQPVGI